MIMVNVLGAYLLLLAVPLHGQYKRWYGPTCQYQCHCAGSAPCKKNDGSCSSGCQIGWFGSACQYESIGFTVLGNSTLDWLTDQNDTTCNNDKETTVYLALKEPIPLGWSRIVVNSPARLRHIELFYYIANENDPIKCPGPKVNMSDTVQDILCPTADNVTKVTVLINEEAGRGLCSFYLSSACVGTHGARCWIVIGQTEHVFQDVCQGTLEQSVIKDRANPVLIVNGSCAEGCDPGYTQEKHVIGIKQHLFSYQQSCAEGQIQATQENQMGPEVCIQN
ncbi:hypothetical protein RRG08_051775 [Elysia crispata]|uniref:Uncharacterized protein n=1 Tax=Elysia crispata TaxID=231223 RepID=A0AAE0Y6X8_9GAST|nr:hypothetical protein RRG08_051775 [Elysia crispata]